MKKFLLAAVALSVLAVPTLADAQPRHGPGHGPQIRHAAPHKIVRKKTVVRRVVRPRAPVAAHWRVGRTVPAWQRGHAVANYGHYGLRRPGAGQRWIRVDNDYLLVSIATGLIAGLVAAN